MTTLGKNQNQPDTTDLLETLKSSRRNYFDNEKQPYAQDEKGKAYSRPISYLKS